MSRLKTTDELFSYLESFTNLERGTFNPREYRLERMQRLLVAFGEPERNYRVMHVAGSKGKGSVCAFATACFAAAGLRTGTYMSPHVSSYLERIQLSGDAPDNRSTVEFIVECGNRLADYVEGLRNEDSPETLPTTFELLTLLAFLVFEMAQVDVAVVEVGLGGRLDATNLVSPAVTVITPIELEHTDYLGPTLASIAREKAGIIKPGVPVVLAEQAPEVRDVLIHVADERGAPVIHAAELASVVQDGASVDGGGNARNPLEITFRDGVQVKTSLRLLGRVQAKNALLASVAVRTLDPHFPPLLLGRGLATAWLPGRGELRPGDPPILLDGAHTPQSVKYVLELALQLEPQRGARILIFGAVTGKKHREMLDILIPAFKEVIISRPGTFKESNVDELLRTCREAGGTCSLHEEMSQALDSARKTHPGLIVVTGSFHLVGEARRILEREGRHEESLPCH